LNLLYTVIGTPLGWIMWVLYQVVKSYGIALFLFTLITRLALFPMSLKQQKSSAKMSAIQPKIQELQKMYANNKEKLNEEMMKLYQKEGYNPMSGCLPLLIQMPILFGLIDVIYRPIKHILHIPADVITKLEETVVSLGLPNITEAMLGRLNQLQIIAIQQIDANPAPFLNAGIGQEYIDQIKTLDLNFLGINLGLTPSWDMFGAVLQGQFNPLIMVPLLSGLSALAMSLITMKTSMSAAANPAAGSMKGMMLIMPIFSFTIAVSVPAGVGIYWFYSNLLAIAQSLILNKYHNPREMAEKAKQEAEEREAKERQERIEAKKKAKEEAKARGEEVLEEKALSQKELNRRKLAEARRRDAEKYGEEYVDVTDEDLR
jgi:YidC/Oxa1 family membrane protein insertase